MALELQPIDSVKYIQEKDKILDLAKTIWTGQESYENIIHSIERWADNKESGKYFYIIQDRKEIGLTGYWPIQNDKGSFGLRHHGTTIKGTGKQSLDLLVNYLRDTYPSYFKHLIEFIPEGKEELINVFKNWGFKLDPRGIPDWEPKKDYYKYSMIKTLK